jgi:hypothetical protein
MRFITFTMTWKWGGSRTVTCSEAHTLEEAAEGNGFHIANGYPITYICNGRILAPQFTLHAHRIRDGQTIILYVPASVWPSFTDSTSGKFNPNKHCFIVSPTLEDIASDEAAKLADLDFVNWECSRSLPVVLSKLLTMIETDEEALAGAGPGEPTVIVYANGISETPLPTLIPVDESWMNV